jgi:hypothetical protein
MSLEIIFSCVDDFKNDLITSILLILIKLKFRRSIQWSFDEIEKIPTTK